MYLMSLNMSQCMGIPKLTSFTHYLVLQKLTPNIISYSVHQIKNNGYIGRFHDKKMNADVAEFIIFWNVRACYYKCYFNKLAQ